MLNLLVASVLGVVTTLALYLPGLLSLGESVVPGLLVLVVSYFVLARRTLKAVEKIFADATVGLQQVPPRFEQAISAMEKAYPLAKQQFGIESQIDTQIGVMYFLQQDWNRALPYLQRSYRFGYWLGGAMLAVIHYKKKDHEAMRSVLDFVTKKSKKQGLAWNLYAYLLTQIGDRDGAMRVLAQGVKHAKDDPRVQESLLALQNDKKLKLKSYKEQWYQFHLERPPAQYAQAAGGQRMSRASLRGRW